METLIEGAALAVLVVFVFLRDWRATLIAAVALPLSAIPTFWAMELLGFSLNLVSLLGITLVTGILVDDAIVEIENIVRHMRMGKSPYRAALEAADEIGLAVIAISLTIVAIFAPVWFMGGIAGQYFRQFGLTVAIAVLFSLLVARLITPMMAAYLMRPVPRSTRATGDDARLHRLPARDAAVRYLTLVAGWRCSPARSTRRPCCRPASCPTKTPRALSSPSNCRPAPARRHARHDRQDRQDPQAMPEVKSVFVLGGTTPTGELEVRKASLFVHLVPKTSAR